MSVIDGYDKSDVLGLLRSHGLVATPQRIKMLAYCLRENSKDARVGGNVEDYFESDSFYEDSGEEEGKDIYLSGRVYSALIEEGYFISLSTIYKNICLFKKLGLIDSKGMDY